LGNSIPTIKELWREQTAVLFLFLHKFGKKEGIRRWGTHPLPLKENGTMATLLSVVVGVVGDLV
jgi:hypothetical protein